MMGKDRTVVMPVAPGDVHIDVCQCGSTDFIMQPSNHIICAVCGRPFVTTVAKADRP